MTTKILKPTQANISECAQAILSGEVVAFPTETVYGLGANVLLTPAVKKIFLAKGRPSDNPLIAHVSRKEQIYAAAEYVPVAAEKLMDSFMPGALTIVLKKKAHIPDIVTGGLQTVGLRMPDNEVALKLIDACGVPLCAPSANTSGAPSPTNAQHVYEDLNGKIGYILDGGQCRIGVESTIVDLTTEPFRVLRFGGISKEQLEKVIGRLDVYEGSGEALCPGMKYRHYSPAAKVYVFKNNATMRQRLLFHYEKLLSEGQRPVILCFSQGSDFYKDALKSDMGADASEYARNIYNEFRRLDKLGYNALLCEAPTTDGMGNALLNRLHKAAGGVVYE